MACWCKKGVQFLQCILSIWGWRWLLLEIKHKCLKWIGNFNCMKSKFEFERKDSTLISVVFWKRIFIFLSFIVWPNFLKNINEKWSGCSWEIQMWLTLRRRLAISLSESSCKRFHPLWKASPWYHGSERSLISPWVMRILAWLMNCISVLFATFYSHSIVAGGLLEIS